MQDKGAQEGSPEQLCLGRTCLAATTPCRLGSSRSARVHQRSVSEVHDQVVAYPQGGQLHEQRTWSATPHLLFTADGTETELKTPHPNVIHCTCILYCVLYTYAYYTHAQSYQPHPLTITYLLLNLVLSLFLIPLKMTPV